MERVEEELKRKYVGKVISCKDVNYEVERLQSNGFIKEDISISGPMNIDNFIRMIKELNRTYFLNDTMFKETQEINNTLYKSFVSFEDSLIVNDLREKTREIIDRKEKNIVKKDDKARIIKDLINKYINYERKFATQKRFNKGVILLGLLVIIFLIILFRYDLTNEPY